MRGRRGERGTGRRGEAESVRGAMSVTPLSPSPRPPLSPSSSPEDLRIVLWDIDGTLVRTRRQGVFKDYTTPVLVRVFGTAGRLRELSGAGVTALQIVPGGLRGEGLTGGPVPAPRPGRVPPHPPHPRAPAS